MRLKTTLRGWFRRVNWILFTVFDLQLRRRSQAEHSDVFATLATLISGSRKVILDVGARSGSTVFSFHQMFPSARIDCFEPSTESFHLLEERFRTVTQVRCNCLAVTDSSGTVQLNLSRTDSTNSLLQVDSEFALAVDPRHVEAIGVEQVSSVSLDEYCEREAIEHVDLLKIDIQGSELTAFRGAERLLTRGQIDLILTEVCFARLYEGQALAWELSGYLTQRGYRLYGLYDLTPGRNGMLAWCDALFVSPQVAERLNRPFVGSSLEGRSAPTAS